jgi:hypothetical protein
VIVPRARSVITPAFFLLAACLGPAHAEVRPETPYRSICDASAAVALDDTYFVVAGDEHNDLLIFQKGVPTPSKHDNPSAIADFLEAGGDKESDLEGAARIGDRIYWISSHGNNSKGEFRERLHRFFATRIENGIPPRVQPIGHYYSKLRDDLLREPRLSKFDLAAASRLPPKVEGGLNIEGLAVWKDDGLLIGFRNPIGKRGALLVPLENPADLPEGGKARFGTPITLDLGGRGIRSIERVNDVYWIVAGPAGPSSRGDAEAFALYMWSGKPGDSAERRASIDIGDLFPEALFAWPNGALQLLSDDGKFRSENCDRLEKTQREFRSLVFGP